MLHLFCLYSNIIKTKRPFIFYFNIMDHNQPAFNILLGYCIAWLARLGCCNTWVVVLFGCWNWDRHTPRLMLHHCWRLGRTLGCTTACIQVMLWQTTSCYTCTCQLVTQWALWAKWNRHLHLRSNWAMRKCFRSLVHHSELSLHLRIS